MAPVNRREGIHFGGFIANFAQMTATGESYGGTGAIPSWSFYFRQIRAITCVRSVIPTTSAIPISLESTAYTAAHQTQ